MKSLIFTLCTIIGFQVAYAQVPLSATLPAINKTYPVTQNMLRHGQGGQAGGQRGVTQFTVDYSVLESVRGGDVFYTTWELNNSYVCNPPVDTADNFTLRWTSVKFDSIVDTENDVSYNKYTFNSLTVDSIYFFFNHTNVSGLNDTLILTMYESAGNTTGLNFAPGGGVVNNTNMIPTNNVLWTDTIITNTSLSTATPFDGAAIEVLDPLGNPVVVPQGKGFVVRIDYYGPEQDVFEVVDFNRYDCGTTDEYASDAYIQNTTRWFNLYLSAQQDFRGISPLFLNATAGCDNYFFQNMGIGAIVSVDAPLSATATASETVACPGTFVTLNSGASGGSGDFSYTWSGNGNFTSPNSTSTSVALPSGNGIETYTVTVVDNIENTTVTSSVNVTVRGITVTLGNDTTLNCGDSILVAANTTGFLNGSTFAWSNAATTQSIFMKGGSTYSVTVTNNAGCSATDSKVVGLNVNQAVSFAASTFYNGNEGDTLVLSQNRACQNEIIFFNNTSTDQSSSWSFEWNYGDQTGSVNVDGLKAYATTGVFTVTLTASDAGGCVITSAPLQVQVLPATHPLCIVDTTGISEVELLSNISLYPNPNNGSFTVDMTNVTADDASIMVVDMMGKVVAATNTFSTTANPVQTVELNNVANGVYFVRITANGVTATSKISVAK